jgi:hypothetical protein
MLIRTLIDRGRRLARRLAHPGLKDLNARRYTWAVEDLFAVPIGTAPTTYPDQSLDDADLVPELDDHPGEWVALDARGIVAVRDTKDELVQALGPKRPGLSVFRAPATHQALGVKRPGLSVSRVPATQHVAR